MYKRSLRATIVVVALILTMLGLPAFGGQPAMLSASAGPAQATAVRAEWGLGPWGDRTGQAPTATPAALPAPTEGASPSSSANTLAAGFGEVFVSPQLSRIASGDTFSVTVMISSTEMMRGAQAGLAFDPAHVQVTGWEEGSFLKDWAFADGALTYVFPQPSIDNANGVITPLGVVIFGGANDDEGPTGSGALVIFTMTARTGISGTTAFTLTHSAISDPNGDLFDSLSVRKGYAVVGIDAADVAVLEPSTASTLTFMDAQTRTTSISVPGEAVTQTLTLAYTPVVTVSAVPTGSLFTGYAFDLVAYNSKGAVIEGLTFSPPITLTLGYLDSDVPNTDAESTLTLNVWSSGAWTDAADTCTPPGTYVRQPDQNRLSTSLCHLSRYALFAAQPQEVVHYTYLPMVLLETTTSLTYLHPQESRSGR